MSGWEALGRELAAWAADGRKPVFWWRDDDATAEGPALQRLLALRRDCALPLALAVIPALIEESLAPLLAGERGIALLQHGFAHRNHARPGEKKRELGDERPAAQVLEELAAGRDRGRAVFADAWLPVMVPPWNRIAQGVAGALPGLGFKGLSTHGRHPKPPAGLVQVNSHLDIMTWKPETRFRGEEPVLADLTAFLAARRREDPPGAEEPIGLLTHHKAHDEAAWSFLQKLLLNERLKDTVSWKGAGSLFSLAMNRGNDDMRGSKGTS